MAGLRPAPPIYGKIIFAPGHGEPNIGGRWKQPDLGRSYLLAARHVIVAGERDGSLGDVCLPAAFLQRHAMEVELKGCLAAVYEIENNRELLHRLSLDPRVEVEAREVPFEHNLDKLLAGVSAALEAIQFQPLPSSVIDLCTQLMTDENRQHSRFRYLTLSGGKQSFPVPEILPIIDRQNALEDVFGSVFHVDENVPPESQTFGTLLSLECYYTGQEPGQRLHAMGLI